MIIIGISGKKKSGKSTLAKDLARFATDLWPKYDQNGNRQICEVSYEPFAKPIKWICHNLLNLSHDAVYGDDDQKNQLTDIRWGNMPHYASLKAKLGHECPEPTEFMRSRDVQQHLGTEIFRAIYEESFTTGFVRSVSNLYHGDFDGLILTDDVRFQNELEALGGVGGYCIRLTRGETTDGHASETSLGDSNSRYDIVLDNSKLSKYMTFGAVVQWMISQAIVKRIDGDVALLRAEAWYRGQS